jgi:hypothetical protein
MQIAFREIPVKPNRTLAFTLCLLICGWAAAQTESQTRLVPPLAARCGSMVFQRCLEGKQAERPDTALGVAMDEERWTFGIGLDEIVVTGMRIRRETIAQVFERNLGTGERASVMQTRNRGNGVMCTGGYCSRSADERPDPIGPMLDWSNWVF